MYQPRSWNQRYCQDPECLREVYRWQAARRQARHRADATARRRHAQAEKERRQRARASPKTVETPDVTPARGHAAETFFRFHCATGRAATNIP
jgi:anti-sigma factor RsiW